MKLTTKIMAGTVALTVLAGAALNLSAQVTNTITFTATVKSQGDTTTNGALITTANPSVLSITTKTILGYLAQDEYAAGHYGATNFPANAKLVVITGPENRTDFQVLTSSNTFLVDVSEIVAVYDGRLRNEINSGRENSTNGLASPTETSLHVMSLSYDDSDLDVQFGRSAVELHFYLTGLVTSTISDTPPVAGAFTETLSSQMTSGAGEGSIQIVDNGVKKQVPFIITGSLSTSGKAKFTLQ